MSNWSDWEIIRVKSTRGNEVAPFSVGENGEEFLNSLHQEYEWFQILNKFWYRRILVITRSDPESFDGYIVTLVKKYH